MSNSLGKFWCRRRPIEEALEEVVVPGQEEIQQVTRMAQRQQKELFEAVERCDVEHIKRLKGQFSFGDIKDRHERTALHVLADLKQSKENNIREEDLKEMFLLLKEGGCGVNKVDEYGNTAVKLAAEKDSVQVLKCLLGEGAEINLPDKFKGDTPLHWAAKNGMFEATKLLIDGGAHKNSQNKDKQTPLHLAVQKKHTGVVYQLLVAGADKNLKDKNEFTPLHIAKRADNKEVVDLLEKSVLKLQMVQRANNCHGGYVETDSDEPPPRSIPWIALNQANPVHVTFNVKVKGGVAAIGPNSQVNNYQDTHLASLSTNAPAQQLPSPTPSSPTTAVLPPPSPSAAVSPTTPSPTAVIPTSPLSPSSMDASPPQPSSQDTHLTSLSTDAPAQQLPSPTSSSPTTPVLPPPSPSTAVSATTPSPTAVIPTAPLSPLSMDTSPPQPSAPPLSMDAFPPQPSAPPEEEGDTS